MSSTQQQSRTLWEQGIESGRSVAALGFALVLTAAALDVLVIGRAGWLFDVSFVVVCVAMALLVRPADFYLIGVLPPVLMVGIFAVLAIGDPGWLARPTDSVLQALITGLSQHALALGFGFGLCFGCLLIRNAYGSHQSLI